MLQLAEKFQNDIEYIKINTATNNGLILNREQVKNLRALQLYFISDFQKDMQKYVQTISEEKLLRVAREVDKYYIDWAREQERVRDTACRGGNFKIEEYRSLLWSLINNYSAEDGLKLLATFCHNSWTRSKVKLVESGSQALYGIVFVAGILFKKLRKFASVVAPTTASFSFLMRYARGIDTLKTERALMVVNLRQEDDRIYNNVINLIAAPLSAVGLHLGSKAIINAGAWRFFVPFRGWSREVNIHATTSFLVSRYADFKSHIDHKLHPFATKNFWLNSFDNMLGLLMGGHALIASSGGVLDKLRATVLFSVTYAMFNIYVPEYRLSAFS